MLRLKHYDYKEIQEIVKIWDKKELPEGNN